MNQYMYEDLRNAQKSSHKFYRGFRESQETIFKLKLCMLRLHRDKEISDEIYKEFIFIIEQGEDKIKRKLGIND